MLRQKKAASSIYSDLWGKIKAACYGKPEGKVIIELNPNMHPRIIQAMRKRKTIDQGQTLKNYGTLLAISEGNRVTFSLIPDLMMEIL